MRSALPFCLTGALLLGGCGSGNNDWGLYLQALRGSLASGFASHDVTREEAAAVPYASLGFRINGGDETILVLATETEGDMLWTAASHVVLLTHDGRVLRSVGLQHDRTATVPREARELPPLTAALKAPYRSTRLVDLPDIGAYSVPVNCITAAKGPQTITIIGTPISTVRVDESCQSTNPRWSFTDNYWLDSKTGFVWHSIQHLHPRTIVQIEIFRPPG